MSATTVTLPSPWEKPASPTCRHPALTTPMSRPSRTPAAVAKKMPSRACSKVTSPSTPYMAQMAPMATTASPNYFGLVQDASSDPSSDAHQVLRGSSYEVSQPPAMGSVAAMSPKLIPADPHSGFEAFRRESWGKTLGAGHDVRLRSAQASKANRGPDDLAKVRMADADVDSGLPGSQMELGSEEPTASTLLPPALHRARTPASDMPRYSSPPSLSLHDTPFPAQSHVSHSELSLPISQVHSHSPLALSTAPSQRAATVPPPTIGGEPSLVTAHELVTYLESAAGEVLLLDIRVSPQFAQSRIVGALNLCIPTTLLKRPSFNLQKLADTFTRPEEKAKFEAWRTSRYLVVYDDRSRTMNDAVSCSSTLKKFASANDGWQGRACILKGGFLEFARNFPNLIDKSTQQETAPSSSKGLSIGASTSTAAPVAGGCPMPSSKTAANPFFGNIRQNMDLIGGVGQIPIKHPSNATAESDANLPAWLRRAVDETDQGKSVAEIFLQIEQAEQRRMQAALSAHVTYGTPVRDDAQSLSIAGIEKGTKNRYNNIWPYDHARVKLQDLSEGTCDYVNASHVKAAWSNRRYIATQGPMPTTFQDFWNVVWEQDVRVIVMLTAEHEGGQLKCHPYWTGKSFGPLQLKPISEHRVLLEPLAMGRDNLARRWSTAGDKPSPPLPSGASSEQPHLIVRTFSLSHASHPFTPMRQITQLQYASWPDFGAPAHPKQVLGLIEYCDAVVRASMSPALQYQHDQPFPGNQRPVLVHCSAGCGRTGTFCTVDSVLDMLKRQRAEQAGIGQVPPLQLESQDQSMSGTEDTVAQTRWARRGDDDLIARTVEQLRGQRISMVQSLRQFVLCYETILEWLVTHPPAKSRTSTGRLS